MGIFPLEFNLETVCVSVGVRPVNQTVSGNVTLLSVVSS